MLKPVMVINSLQMNRRFCKTMRTMKYRCSEEPPPQPAEWCRILSLPGETQESVGMHEIEGRSTNMILRGLDVNKTDQVPSL